MWVSTEIVPQDNIIIPQQPEYHYDPSLYYGYGQNYDEYEEQFTDYQDQGGSTSEQPMYDEQGFEIEFFDNDTAILESTYAIDGWNNTVIYYGGAPVSREPSRTTSPTNIPNIP